MSRPKLNLVDESWDRMMGAAMFLHALDPDTQEFCFQTFDDVALPDGKKRNKTGLARTLHGRIEDLWPELCRLNDLDAGVFVTANSLAAGERRTNKNVKRCRTVWSEHDGGHLPDFPLEPSLIVETSPGKHHFYWLVSDELSPEQHQAIMRAMCEGYGSDPNAKDLARVLRLPGTFHRKGQPHEVTFAGTERRYTGAELVEAFKAEPQAPTAPEANTVERKPADESTVRDALKHVPIDVIDSRHTWVTVGMILRDTFGEELGRELWDEASARSHKFDADMQEKTWASFAGRKPDKAATLGTIYHHAIKGGWVRPRASVDDEFPDIDVAGNTATRKTRLEHCRDVSLEAMAARQKNALIAGIAMRGECGGLYGHPGTGKSFIGCDIGFHVALGKRVARKTCDACAGPVRRARR
jgi:RepB DNA-primase from phage plasmid/Primase C terminal 2 (PriCT-2)/AAA domain